MRSGFTDRMEAYALRYPRQGTRTSLQSDLRQAHQPASLSNWTTSKFQQRSKELGPQPGARDHLAVNLTLVHGFHISTTIGIEWEHLEERGDATYLTSRAKNAPVFTSSPRSNRKLSTRSLRRRIDSYTNKAQLKCPGLSAHSIPLSATLLMENGGNLLELRQHLGHKSPETSIHYLARLDRVADAAVSKIPIRSR